MNIDEETIVMTFQFQGAIHDVTGRRQLLNPEITSRPTSSSTTHNHATTLRHPLVPSQSH